MEYSDKFSRLDRESDRRYKDMVYEYNRNKIPSFSNQQRIAVKHLNSLGYSGIQKLEVGKNLICELEDYPIVRVLIKNITIMHIEIEWTIYGDFRKYVSIISYDINAILRKH
jgi:hypothetical protein